MTHLEPTAERQQHGVGLLLHVILLLIKVGQEKRVADWQDPVNNCFCNAYIATNRTRLEGALRA